KPARPRAGSRRRHDDVVRLRAAASERVREEPDVSVILECGDSSPLLDFFTVRPKIQKRCRATALQREHFTPRSTKTRPESMLLSCSNCAPLAAALCRWAPWRWPTA